MRIIRAIVVTAGAIGLVGSALAADMTASEIKTFLSGKSFYVETTAASATGKPGQGVIYWAADGTALYKTPSGAIWHGKWKIKGNTACADWQEKPNNPCDRFDKIGDTVTIIDAVSGQTRGRPFVQCMSPVLAQSGHGNHAQRCPLLGE